MAWRLFGTKPLSESMLICSPMHICVSQPQWVNTWFQWIRQRQQQDGTRIIQVLGIHASYIRDFMVKTVFPGMGIPMWKIRWSQDHFIFNMWMRWHLYIEMPPGGLNSPDARDKMMWLIWPIPCLLITWLLKSPRHQQECYCQYRIYGQHIGLLHWKSGLLVRDMIQNMNTSFKQFSMLKVDNSNNIVVTSAKCIVKDPNGLDLDWWIPLRGGTGIPQGI